MANSFLSPQTLSHVFFFLLAVCVRVFLLIFVVCIRFFFRIPSSYLFSIVVHDATRDSHGKCGRKKQGMKESALKMNNCGRIAQYLCFVLVRSGSFVVSELIGSFYGINENSAAAAATISH